MDVNTYTLYSPNYNNKQLHQIDYYYYYSIENK